MLTEVERYAVGKERERVRVDKTDTEYLGLNDMKRGLGTWMWCRSTQGYSRKKWDAKGWTGSTRLEGGGRSYRMKSNREKGNMNPYERAKRKRERGRAIAFHPSSAFIWAILKHPSSPTIPTSLSTQHKITYDSHMRIIGLFSPLRVFHFIFPHFVRTHSHSISAKTLLIIRTTVLIYRLYYMHISTKKRDNTNITRLTSLSRINFLLNKKEKKAT